VSRTGRDYAERFPKVAAAIVAFGGLGMLSNSVGHPGPGRDRDAGTSVRLHCCLRLEVGPRTGEQEYQNCVLVGILEQLTKLEDAPEW
jgi:hypothetical protein